MSLVAPTSPSESELRAQICRVGANLFQFGFTNVCPMGWILKKLGVPESRVACAR